MAGQGINFIDEEGEVKIDSPDLIGRVRGDFPDPNQSFEQPAPEPEPEPEPEQHQVSQYTPPAPMLPVEPEPIVEAEATQEEELAPRVGIMPAPLPPPSFAAYSVRLSQKNAKDHLWDAKQTLSIFSVLTRYPRQLFAENKPYFNELSGDVAELLSTNWSEFAESRKGNKAYVREFARDMKQVKDWNVAYAMAAVLFIFGMGVAANGLLINNKADEQIASLAETQSDVLGDASGTPTEPSSGSSNLSIPSEDSITGGDYLSHVVAPKDVRYINLPSISVSSRVLSVGTTPEGAVDTPHGIYDTGLYDGSASVDSEDGAMFMVAHVSGPTQRGIFFNLKELSKGDVVTLELGDGSVRNFAVVQKKSYPIGQVDMQKALTSARAGALGLNLMTCGGQFDSAAFNYTERVLVRTVEI